MPRRPRNPEVTKTLGLRVRAAREAANLTQSELGNLIQSTAPTISRLESGHMAPTLTTLTAIATGLGVSVASLFDAPDATFVSTVTSDSLSPSEALLVKRFQGISYKAQQAVLQMLEAIQQ